LRKSCIALIAVALLSCATYDTYKPCSHVDLVLGGVVARTQHYPYSCSLAAMSVVGQYLAAATDEDVIRKELRLENRNKGMLPGEFLEYSNELFNKYGYRVSLENKKTPDEIFKAIIASLERRLPVIMYYSTINAWDRKNYDTHYSVIYGVNTVARTVKVSNAYGFLEELTFEEFLAGLNFSNYNGEPFVHVLGRVFGIIGKNNLFIITKER
jgi:hypothetical protein